jgi:hypothetical protein
MFQEIPFRYMMNIDVKEEISKVGRFFRLLDKYSSESLEMNLKNQFFKQNPLIALS